MASDQERRAPYVSWHAPGIIWDCPFPRTLLAKKDVLMYPISNPLLNQDCPIFSGNPHKPGGKSCAVRNCQHTIICKEFYSQECPPEGPAGSTRLPWLNYVYARIWDPEEQNDNEYVNIWSALAIDASFGSLHFSIIWTRVQHWCLCDECQEEWFDRNWMCPMAIDPDQCIQYWRTNQSQSQALLRREPSAPRQGGGLDV